MHVCNNQISNAANLLNIEKWDYGASFSNDYSVQLIKVKQNS